MNCPVCQYSNPPQATHCGMCHEVFNRSAAQSYLHAVKRERRQTEGIPEEPPSAIQGQWIAEEAQATLVSLLKRPKAVMLIGGGLLVLWMVAPFLSNSGASYHLFGKKFVY